MKIVYFGPTEPDLHNIRGLEVLPLPTLQGLTIKVRVMQPAFVVLQPGIQIGLACKVLRELVMVVVEAPPIFCVAPNTEVEALQQAGAQVVYPNIREVKELLLQKFATQLPRQPERKAGRKLFGKPAALPPVASYSRTFEHQGKFYQVALKPKEWMLLEILLKAKNYEVLRHDLIKAMDWSTPTSLYVCLNRVRPILEPLGFKIELSMGFVSLVFRCEA